MEDIVALRDKLAGIKVLYVEDEPYVREITMDFLIEIFSHVDSACDGEEGLDMYRNGNYQLVISDLKMPKMNGRDMLRKIHELNEKTALMVMTASDSNIDVTTTITDAFMHKPVDLVEFITVLASLQDKILAA